MDGQYGEKSGGGSASTTGSAVMRSQTVEGAFARAVSTRSGLNWFAPVRSIRTREGPEAPFWSPIQA